MKENYLVTALGRARLALQHFEALRIFEDMERLQPIKKQSSNESLRSKTLTAHINEILRKIHYHNL
jgi:hypothetical protein